MSVSPAPTSTSRVSKISVERAVDALLKWMRAQLKKRQQKPHPVDDDDDDDLYLILTLKKIPPAAFHNKPHRIPLPHPLIPSASICLLLDDRPKSPLPPSAARALLKSSPLTISSVLGLSDLRSDYNSSDSRRRLHDSHGLFFADRNILPLLPRLLGDQFSNKKKKAPFPLDLSSPDWPEEIRGFCRSTLLRLRSGTCIGLRVGRASQDRDEVVENVASAIAEAVRLVPKKWCNVRALHVKSSESLALPVYQSVVKEGLKVAGLEKKRRTRSADVGEEMQNKSKKQRT